MAGLQNNNQLKIKFTEGLLGLDNFKNYVLKEVPDNSFFKILQSEEEEEISFLLLSPQGFFPQYRVEVSPEIVKELEGDSIEDLSLYCVVTLADKWEDITANLIGPVLINEKKGLGKQVVLENTEYKTKHYVFPPQEKVECG